MADRKSLLSRFWPPSSSRRTSTTQTAAPPPPASTPSPSSRTSPTSAPPPRAQTKMATRKSTTKASSSPPAPTTPPRTQPRKADQPSSASPGPSKSSSGEVQKASQKTTTPSTDSKDEPKTSSPSRATARSPSSSKPASPSRLSAQSRSPPQPSSPSRVASQTSQTPSTPKRASKPLSPSRATSHSPKQGLSASPKRKLPASPSKGSTEPTGTISTSYEAPILSSKERGPKPAATQQEPEMKEEVKSDSNKVVNGLTREEKPSQLSELCTAATSSQGPETGEAIKSLDSLSVNGGHEAGSDAKPEETKDVKEVVQIANTGANEETQKEADDSSAPKSVSEAQIVEKADTPVKADQIQREKQEAFDRKEISSTPADGTTSQPAKRSINPRGHDQSALPNGEQVPLHKNIKADMSEFANQMAKGDPKNAISDRPVSVVTLVGENRGASMQLESDSSKREKPVHIHRSYKINPDESPEATTDAEESSEGKKSGDERSMEDQLMEAYVNNNAQGINNSIVLNCSIIEGNPGVHMVINHLPKDPVQSKDKTSSPETRKAEVNMIRAEKLTYQPTVRRRCLRGLLLETSDSDPENPEKPRSQGCRVGCQKGDRENNTDVL